MAQKNHKFKISFRTILSILTFILVVFVIYQNWPDIVEAFHHLGDANIFVLLLLIPEQLYMYYALGQIFFSYLEKKGYKKIDWRLKLRISTELNFINHAVPAGGVGGLTFLAFRFKPFHITPGHSSFLYIFRYAITTVVNYLQALIAIIILLSLNLIPESATWIIWVSLLMNVGVFIMLSIIIFVASGKKRIDFFSNLVTKIVNGFIRIITFGRKKHAVKSAKINQYFSDMHESLLIAKKDKKSLKKPIFWGIIYSFFEVGTYWLVAISLGRPELLPYIMVGEAIGSVFDGIVPYGLYELGMASVMIALGVDFPTATIVVVMTRVATLLFTILIGYYPYNKTLKTLGKEDESRN